jgi:ubiquinone/menaquinone biosynthesis C-methylase UbiE
MTEDQQLFRDRMEHRQTEEYRRFFGPVTSKLLPAVVAAAGDGDGRTAADIGCGDGELAELLGQRGWRCVAFDRSRLMAGHAGRRLGRDRVAVADAFALPLADSSLDTAVSAFLLPHLDELDRAFAELRRVVRAGGGVHLATWGPPDRSPFTGLAMELIRARADPAALAVFDDLAARTGPGRLGLLLARAGFELVDVTEAAAEVRPGTPQQWWHGLIGGSFGLASLLNRCPPPKRSEIRAEFLARAAAGAVDGVAVTKAETVVMSAVAV